MQLNHVVATQQQITQSSGERINYAIIKSLMNRYHRTQTSPH